MESENISSLAQLSTTANIIQDVRTILQEARRLTARTVNSAMITAYWLIGKRIAVEEQHGKRTGELWGTNLEETISITNSGIWQWVLVCEP